MSVNSQNKIEFLPIGEILRRRYPYVIAFVVLGLVTAFVFSKVVTPLYESYVIMYPSNSNSRDKQLEDFSFGHEVQAERLMQLLSSNILLDSLDARFDLAKHYDIDRTAEDWYDQLLEITHDRITFNKNKYVSVGISVADAEPEFCAKVANETARLVNVINADIVKSAARASLDVVEREYQRRRSRVLQMSDSIIGLETSTISATQSRLQLQSGKSHQRIQILRDSLDRLRQQYNVYDFSFQTNVLNEHLAEAKANYLQEAGILAVMEQNPQIPDSSLQRHRALLNGAKLRTENFEKELQQLGKINKRYTSLEAQLHTESMLQENITMGMQTYENMVDPNLESRRINRLETDYEWDQLQTQELSAKYQKALSNYLDPVPAAIVVSAGKASYKKIYPHTLVNLALGGFGGLFFSLLLFSFIDRRKGGPI